MLLLTDPSELKPADVYRQARLVSSKTSRGSDRNWYRDAFELACQWHLWFDGGREVCSATFSRDDNCWRPGPVIPLSSLTTGDGIEDLLGELLSPSFFGHQPKALGIILHVADEFALAGLAPLSNGPGNTNQDLEILRYNLMDDPREVLADREVSVETTSWRLLPFWGAPAEQARCTAIALSRSREAFLGRLLAHGEEFRLPIRVAVTAAPVEALAGLPLLAPTLQGGRLIVMPYVRFTAVFAINRDGELRSARSLSHRGGALVPVGLGDILWSMAASAELTADERTPPEVLVVSSEAATLTAATRELEIYSASRNTIKWEFLDFSNHPAVEGVPGHRPEFLACDPTAIQRARSGDCPLAQTETFGTLWSRWITGSSFFDTVRLDARYPTLKDLRLLKIATLIVALMAMGIIGSAAYGGYSLFSAMRHPSWNLTPVQIKTTEDNLAKLQVERRQVDITNRLLVPRSRGWVNLEFLLQIFPEDSGVRLESFTYGLEASRPAPPAAKGKITESTGMVRTWSFKGLAKPQALELLSNLNSQRGLNALFDRVAQAIGDASCAPAPTRQITVALTQGRNPKFGAQPGGADSAPDPTAAFPFTFEATVSQTISDSDTMALPTEKPF